MSNTTNATRARVIPSVAALRRQFYPDPVTCDPVATFVQRLNAIVRPGDSVLDLGAGAGELNQYALRGRVRRLVGVDCDPRVRTNALLDAGLEADICALPFQDASFDIAFSIYVFEHIERPTAFLSELHRVLRPGGVCLMLTPNAYHYVSLAARMTPTPFHRWVNERRGRRSADTFPTFYRLNSRSALRRQFSAAGFRSVAIDTIEVQPNYLTFNPLAYALGVGFERIVNASDWFAGIRVNLIGLFERPAVEGWSSVSERLCRR